MLRFKRKREKKVDADRIMAIGATAAYAFGLLLRHRNAGPAPVHPEREPAPRPDREPAPQAEHSAQPQPREAEQRRRFSIKSLPALLKQTFAEFNSDRVLRLSAALAYYALFSIGPLLLVAVGVAGWVLGEATVRGQIEAQLRGLIGDRATHMVESMMVARSPSTGIVTTIVGTFVVLSGAGGVFGQLQDSLNTIWKVQPKPGRGIRGMIRDRFLSWAMVLGIGFLLLVSMILSTALAASTEAVSTSLSIPPFVAHALDVSVSFVVVTALFAMIFKFLPDVKIPWHNVWGGAAGTALLFSIGKVALAFYLGRATTASAYGAAGSVVIVMMWVYYASVILFIGAEFTQVYTASTGHRPKPTSNAIPVEAAQRAAQGMPASVPATAPS